MFKEENLTKNNEAKNNNLEILKQNFSHCFDKNWDFDFLKFKSEISKNEIDFSKESYWMDWLGKSYARVLASDPARTLLKEDKDWNGKQENKNSENVLIKWDNLEVLKHLSNAYHEKVKMIYIDPPYNTGSDGFVYQDDRKFDVKEFSKLAWVDEEKSKRILDFVDSKSNSHSAWLTFMYPRLYIAKQLLKDDWVIFVSIDDNEVAQLKILMDEIFGEENFVGTTIRKTKWSATTQSDAELQSINDYMLIYFKSKSLWAFNKKIIWQKKYPYEDERWKYYIVPLQDNWPNWTKEARPNLYYPIYLLENWKLSYIKDDNYKKEYLPSKHQNKEWCWMWSKKKFDLDNIDLTIHNEKVHIKHYYDENEDQNKYQREKLYLQDFLNAKWTKRLNDLFITKWLFSHPKPIELLLWCLKISTSNNDLILDFFWGSWSTWDAVMQANFEDLWNRKYIMVQLPEIIDEKSSKIAYNFVKNELWVEEPTIFEITKERLIRASKKIQEDNVDKKASTIKEKCDCCEKETSIKIPEQKAKDLSNIDFWFKVFETTPIWEDYNIESEEFSENLKLFDETKLNEEDLQTLLTTWKTADNIALTQDLQEIDLDWYIAYYFEDKLYLMNKDFETKNLKALLEKIDSDKTFEPKTIIAFGYHFESKNLREIDENIKAYSNKKNIDIDFITRY